MRFNVKEKQIDCKGDYRLRGKFLLFPKTLNGETRWLENAVWQQVCAIEINGLFERKYMWDDVDWYDLQS